MNIIKSAIDIVKDIGATVWKYVKYQFYPNDYVDQFIAVQKKLERQLEDVEAKLKTQCMQPGKIARKEVADWMEKAGQQIAITIKDLISQGECSSTSNLQKKIEELKQTFEQGEKYANASESLVVDDHSIKYCAPVFKEKQERLKHQKEQIETSLKTQCMQPGKIARKEVKEWLEKAGQQIAIRVEDLISQGECSSFANLKENTEELRQILEEGKEFNSAGVILVIDDHSTKGVPLFVEKCSGRNDIQDQILECLKRDKVTRIAVWGMAGVGKTTIVKQVHNQLLKEPKFDKVIWVQVSKDFDIIVQQKRVFNILKFQKSIAPSLELELQPQDESETKLAGLISQRLGQGNFVLILDDVWEPFSLEDVGIPDLVGNNGCKLVLTTRSKHVARVMDCNVIHVNHLPPDEALALFLGEVGSDMLLDGKIKGDVKPFLKEILQRCGGVPFAIVTVAKSMRGKLLPRHWKLALSEFSQFDSIVDCLKSNFERLESQCQECFLYCALYPKDYEIPKEELIEYWIEEGLVYKEGKTREAMNWKGHDILDKLVDNCLLESVKNRFREDCVRMQDLLREMVLEISPQFSVKAGMTLEELPEEHEWREDLLKVSLMRNYMIGIPSSIPSPKCPMLTTLLLSNNNILTIPDAFFEHMLGLKILDLSWNRRLIWLPSSISKLEKLTTLLLDWCDSLIEVPSLSNLVGLKKLDLSWTPIKKLPHGLNMLTNLKCLGLGGGLPETLDELIHILSKLQHLTVYTKTKFKWGKIGSWGKLQKLERLNLCNLDISNELFGEIGAVVTSAPPPAGTFSFLLYVGVHHCDRIKKLFSVRWLWYLQKLHTIDVRNCEQLEEIIGSESERGEGVTLPKLESLTLMTLPQLKRIYSGSSIALICDSIKKIEIRYCKNIESVFWSGFNPLSSLEYLEFFDIENLKSVFDEEGLGLSPLVPPRSLFSLKEIRVNECHQLKKVFSSGWLLNFFPFLETIDVGGCSQMEELISSSSAYEEEKVTLPKLQRLQLVKLPQVKSICSSSSVLTCDSIQILWIFKCEKLKRIPLNLPLLDNAQLSHPPSLKKIAADTKEWWESLEWDHPNAKDILLPFCQFR